MRGLKTTLSLRVVGLVLVLCVVGGVGSLVHVAAATAVPQLDAYSAGDRAQLLAVLATLEPLLADTTRGSRQPRDQGSWGTREFALYTAGALEQLGYATVVVVRSDSGGPTHWVLVRVALAARDGFLPVDPIPAAGAMQYTLGRVPGVSLGTTDARFDERYLTYDEVIVLPTNQPPVAQIRKPIGTLLVGEKILLLGVLSSDPDGWIVGYRWRVGTQNPAALADSSFYYEFEAPGSYPIELTVVDNRGATATTTLEVVVVDLSEAGEPADCGCGKK
jgi:hypothetical protein